MIKLVIQFHDLNEFLQKRMKAANKTCKVAVMWIHSGLQSLCFKARSFRYDLYQLSYSKFGMCKVAADFTAQPPLLLV